MDKFQTPTLIQDKFAEYYKQNVGSVQPPTSMDNREFAFSLFRQKAMLRHKGFKEVQVFHSFLSNLSPSDVYYSSAYYESPEQEMSSKGWLGADLIFDIDADHIPTPCDKSHNIWICKACHVSGRGTKPLKCPHCGGQKFSNINWPCSICLESAKRETIKLIEILELDYGVSTQELVVAFSGHRGYHVQVEDEAVRTLDSMARREITDYLTGIGLDLALQGVDVKRCIGPYLEDVGWKGRLARGTYELLARPEKLEKAGLKKISSVIASQGEQIQGRWKRRGPWGLITGVGSADWEKIIQHAIEQQSVKIDTVVTADTHRLIRLAGTLHGETGLKKVQISPNEVERFDPLKSALVFKHGTITVDVEEAPEFRIGDADYGPFRNEQIELPTAAAMLLLCKGVARAMEETAGVQ